MAELEVELEAQPQAGKEHSDNAEELVSFVSNNKQNNDSNFDTNKNNRQQLAKTGQDHVNDGDVGVPTKHSNIPGATMNFVNSMFRFLLSVLILSLYIIYNV